MTIEIYIKLRTIKCHVDAMTAQCGGLLFFTQTVFSVIWIGFPVSLSGSIKQRLYKAEMWDNTKISS